LGKANDTFQKRLRHPSKEKNLYRHEWVSLRLFQAFVGEDDDASWLQRLATPTAEDDACWLAKDRLFRDGLDDNLPLPFAMLPPLAAVIAWLIVTHHRLPTLPAYNDKNEQEWLGKRCDRFDKPAQLDTLLTSMSHAWNEQKRPAERAEIEGYWRFAAEFPAHLPRWRAQASKLATRLLALRDKPGKGDWLSNPYVMHVGRLSLMLADHHYSALPHDAAERMQGDSDRNNKNGVFANTGKDRNGKVTLKQPLDEHLLGVARDTGAIVHGLPGFERYLPRLARHHGLRKRSGAGRFAWQDKAADAAEAVRIGTVEHGAFIINMASTGCGKTLANARIMNALADPQRGLRCTFALGLRTLTLQTGRSYRDDLHLGDDELAVHVGGSANRDLFEYYAQQAENTGSASIQSLLEEDSHVFYEGQSNGHPLLEKAMSDASIRKLLCAPMLVCTIDHLMPATEAQRAGRQIAPMLRMMSADLVLDELDDFDLADLPALTRLVHWAGLLGTRVLISSATLPPALIDGMYQSYRAGRLHYQNNRGNHGGQPPAAPDIVCLWTDEFQSQSSPCANIDAFRQAHADFITNRVTALKNQIEREGPRRRGKLLPLTINAKKAEDIHKEFAAQVRTAIIDAHKAHAQICPRSGKRVSFGLVRMANIEPLFDVALELLRLGAAENHHIHLCVYHSRFPLLLRSAIEHRLDTTLNRRDPQALWDLPEIRASLDAHAEQEHLFVVLGSPVTEVGRDHDYDWAVVEPSSMRSLIQLAGRVQRHRNQRCESPNIFIFDTNLKNFSREYSIVDKQPRAAFLRPGFESDALRADDPFRLIKHRLTKLLHEDEFAIITAQPRIQPRAQNDWRPKENLVDLEHARLLDCMLPSDDKLNAACAWLSPHSALTWALPQQQPFRDDSATWETDMVFLPDEDAEELILHRIETAKGQQSDVYVKDDLLLHRLDLDSLRGPRITRWGQDDLLTLLSDLADAQDLTLRQSAERFAVASVPRSERGWRYHEALGFGKKK
jgi:CRISPR-associated endonuclease/helicase Cas3